MSETVPESLYDLSYTYHWSSYTCISDFYYAHMISCYVVAVAIIVCFITRLHPVMHFLHEWFGRIYILAMLWATATSLLIHNNGLPDGVLRSFANCLIGLSIGWLLILIHKKLLTAKALEHLGSNLNNNDSIKDNESQEEFNLENKINETKGVIQSNRSIIERIFSLKAFHGAFMFMSSINILGRVAVTPWNSNFTCHTYAIYKPSYFDCANNTIEHFNSTQFQLLPSENPDYDQLPWANNENNWQIYLSVIPFLGGLVFGLIWSLIAMKIEKNKSTK